MKGRMREKKLKTVKQQQKKKSFLKRNEHRNMFCNLSNQSRMEEVSSPCSVPGGTPGWDGGREVSGEPSSEIPAPPQPCPGQAWGFCCLQR